MLKQYNLLRFFLFLLLSLDIWYFMANRSREFISLRLFPSLSVMIYESVSLYSVGERVFFTVSLLISAAKTFCITAEDLERDFAHAIFAVEQAVGDLERRQFGDLEHRFAPGIYLPGEIGHVLSPIVQCLRQTVMSQFFVRDYFRCFCVFPPLLTISTTQLLTQGLPLPVLRVLSMISRETRCPWLVVQSARRTARGLK